MPRTSRAIVAGGLYHVLNRGNGGQELCGKPEDFRAFLQVLAEGLERGFAAYAAISGPTEEGAGGGLTSDGRLEISDVPFSSPPC